MPTTVPGRATTVDKSITHLQQNDNSVVSDAVPDSSTSPTRATSVSTQGSRIRTVNGAENHPIQPKQAPIQPLDQRKPTPVSIGDSTSHRHSRPTGMTKSQFPQRTPARKSPYDKSTQTEPGQVTTDKPDHTASVQSRTDGQPAQSSSTENTELGPPATDTNQTETKPTKKVVEFHKPNWKERLVAAVKVVGSYLIAPLKLAAKAVELIVWKPLKKFIITPIYVVGLYLFNREKYDARKMGQVIEATKAARVLEQANERARTRAYQLLARQAVDAEDHKAQIEKYKPSQRANKLFHSLLAKGELTLKKKIGVDPVTGKSKFTEQAVVRCSDQVMDTDTADTARRLGNDPALRKAMNEYNEAVDAHQKAMAEHDKAVKRARQKGESLPAEPVLTAVPPVFKCTDQYVIPAYKNASNKLLDNLKAKADALHKELNEMIAESRAQYPVPQVNPLQIRNDAEKAQREGMLNDFHQKLQDAKAHLAKCETDGEQHPMVPHINAAIAELYRNIDNCERCLAIYANECELNAVREELDRLVNIIPDYLKHRDEDAADCRARERLNTHDWQAPVMKDKDGNILEVFTRNANGDIIALDSDKSRLATHIERSFKQMITPEHNGSEMPTPVPYQDQQGLTWSRVDPNKHPYQSYLAVQDVDGSILKDPAGNVIDWQIAPGQLNNHWEVKPTLITGKHEGYNKYAVSVKNTGPFDGMSATQRKYPFSDSVPAENQTRHNSGIRSEIVKLPTRPGPVTGASASPAGSSDKSDDQSYPFLYHHGAFKSPQQRIRYMDSASKYVEKNSRDSYTNHSVHSVTQGQTRSHKPMNKYSVPFTSPVAAAPVGTSGKSAGSQVNQLPSTSTNKGQGQKPGQFRKQQQQQLRQELEQKFELREKQGQQQGQKQGQQQGQQQ